MASATKRARKPNLERYYRRRLSPVTPGEYGFSLVLIRAPFADFVLDALVESFEWVDERAALTGNVQLRRPEPYTHEALPIGRGYRIRCTVKWGGRRFVLWTMRCKEPETTIDDAEVTVSVSLVDDMDLVERSEKDRSYRVTKRRKRGFFPHEMVRREAARDGVRVGRLAKCEHRMAKVHMKDASLLDFAVKVYGHEHEQSGRTFVVRMFDGKFEVIPYRRNQTLYVLAGEIRNALVSRRAGSKRPPTVLTGKARIGTGSKAKKVEHTEYRRAMVARFGYTHKTKDYKHVKTREELRTKVRRDLAKYYRVSRRATVQVQGLPFIRRGDGCEMDLASEGFRGDRRFVFCTAARHQVQQGTYTSEVDLTVTDPYLKSREKAEKEQRERKSRERKKRSG